MAAFKSIKNIFSNKKNGYEHEPNDGVGSIDYNMQLSQNKELRTIRILLLGPGDSGKTTIVKQMRKIHDTLTEEDFMMMAPYIQDAVVGYIKLLCFQCKELNEKEEEKTKVSDTNEPLRQYMLNLHSPYNLNEELGAQIATLWADPALKETLRLRSKFQIHDNVDYFLDRIGAISKENYQPGFEDFIRIRTRSTGFATEQIEATIENFGDYTFEFTDVGGQRSERKKWMKIVVDQIQAVLYVVALSEYDMRCFEDNKTNRLTEALDLFKEIVGGKFFNGKSVLVFFNKYDLFAEKIKDIPISVAFDDFPTDEDADPYDEMQAVKFVAGKFLQCFDGKNIKLATPLHIHRTSALDTNNIERVFRDITLDLVKTNLKKCGMM